MPDIDEVAASIGGNAEQAREVATALGASKELVTRLAGEFGALGANDKTAEANAVGDDLEQLAQQQNALAEQIEAARNRAEALRGLLASTGAVGGVAAVVPALRSAGPRPPRRIEDFNPRRFDRRGMEGIPTFTDIGTAEGRLYTAQGEELANGPLRASKAGPAATATDIKPPWTNFERARQDVEANVAAMMRRWDVREAVLYLNTPPCKGPYGCDVQLPALLPVGTTLHVHAVDWNGQPFSKSYTGTGEALK